MKHIFYQILYFITVFVLALGPGVLYLLIFKWRRREKRSPICRDILRGPGESLRLRLAMLDDQLNDQIFNLIFVPVIASIFTLAPTLARGGTPSTGNYLSFIIAYLILLPVPLIKFTRIIPKRANCQLGLDAELAVGRELNQIMREGFYVFHDFPEEHNNIDHVVVGPSGVFAVETKGRPKPDKGRGSDDAKVLFNGDAFVFPDNVKETEYISQARKQAASLSKWLSSAVGEPVKVKAALALPGWYIKWQKSKDLIILFGKSENYANALKGREVLSATTIQRIVHQLESKCRDVEPLAYKKKNSNGKK